MRGNKQNTARIEDETVQLFKHASVNKKKSDIQC